MNLAPVSDIDLDHVLMILRAGGSSGHDITDSPFKSVLESAGAILTRRGFAERDGSVFRITERGKRFSTDGEA